MRLDVFCRLASQVGDQRADHAAYGFVHQPPRNDFGMFAAHVFHVAREDVDALELVYRQQSRTQTVVHVVIVVRDFIGEIGELRFQRRAAGA